MNNEERNALRTRMRAMRRAMSDQAQREAAQKLCSCLSAWPPYRQAKTVMAYVACRGELSLEAVIREIIKSGRTLALPRCEAPGIMTARRVRSEEDLAPGRYGLLEPRAECEEIPPQTIDLILAPGTAFDRRGGRLGQGGGYYDRFLPGTKALRVGVCHEAALLDAAPIQAHDALMDYVFTPGGVIACRKERTEVKCGRT